MISRPLAALGLALLGACTAKHTAAPSSSSDARAFISTIELCKTTEADLRARLGDPTRDGRLAAAHVMSWMVSNDDVLAYLAVLLDPSGRVTDLYWDIPTEIPWTPTDHCAP